MRSTWELKADHDGDGKHGDHNRKIRVEFRIETNRGGQLWTWTISDNGMAEAQGQNRTERGNNGSTYGARFPTSRVPTRSHSTHRTR